MPARQRQARDQLTAKQRRLVHELVDIASLVKVDYTDIRSYKRPARTQLLEMMLRKLIISEVVTSYTLTDEHLNLVICHYFFGKKANFIRLWKTKRFKLFNYHILEELPLLAKLRFVKSIWNVPKTIAADIERLNSLRNGLAHAFFPENLRRSKPEWKGKKIFAAEGLRRFLDDMAVLDKYFWVPLERR